MEIILKYLKVLLKYRKLIVYNALIFTVVATIISLVLPQKFKTTARILPPSEETDVFGALSSAGLSIPKLSRLARGGSLFSGSTPSDLIAVIMQSRTILEQVVKDNDLLKVYKVKKGIEPALKTLARATEIKVGEEGVIELTVIAKKPKLAADIANDYITKVDKFLKESNMSRGHNMRVFLEKRIEAADHDIQQASDSLRIFQEKNKVVSLDDETRAVIDQYAKLKSELLKREMELAISSDVSTEDNPYVLETKREIDNFKKQLNEIEIGKGGSNGFGAGFAVAFSKLPLVGQEYAQKLRDFKVQEEIFSLLQEQYEQAKILEARDTPNITVLDYARVPERRSFPKRKIIILFAFVLSLFGSALVAFGNEYWNRLQQNEQRVQDIRKIKETVSNDFQRIRSKFRSSSKKPQNK
jgi:tyrosine-protein kinase Etk/Wzc